MEHLKVLLIKFISCMVIFWISLGLLFNATFVVIISFSLLVTTISYFIGDQIILPRMGKKNAVIVDFFLTYSVVFLFGAVFFHSYLMIGWGSIISASLITISEVYVHSYIIKNVKDIIPKNPRNFNQRFAYEFAEEQDSNPNKEK